MRYFLFVLLTVAAMAVSGQTVQPRDWQDELISAMLPVELEDGKVVYFQKTEFTEGLMSRVLDIDGGEATSFPVTGLSFNDVLMFIEQLNAKSGRTFRLPKWSEWTFAASEAGLYRFAGSNDIESVGWYTKNSGRSLHPVSELSPNSFGLYDMTGNVAEYVIDDQPEDEFGEFLLMGGTGVSKKKACLNSCVLTSAPDHATNTFGFRLVLDEK